MLVYAFEEFQKVDQSRIYLPGIILKELAWEVSHGLQLSLPKDQKLDITVRSSLKREGYRTANLFNCLCLDDKKRIQ